MNDIIIERIKFYADTPECEKNKYFCFKITSILEYENCLKRFIEKGFIFRAVYYEKINKETGEIENIKQPNLQILINKLAADLLRAKKK